MFDRFYRSTESRTMPGSGLGLSIVRQVAERHGGTRARRASTEPEGGAAFWLYAARDRRTRPDEPLRRPWRHR